MERCCACRGVPLPCPWGPPHQPGHSVTPTGLQAPEGPGPPLPHFLLPTDFPSTCRTPGQTFQNRCRRCWLWWAWPRGTTQSLRSCVGTLSPPSPAQPLICVSVGTTEVLGNEELCPVPTCLVSLLHKAWARPWPQALCCGTPASCLQEPLQRTFPGRSPCPSLPSPLINSSSSGSPLLPDTSQPRAQHAQPGTHQRLRR